MSSARRNSDRVVQLKAGDPVPDRPPTQRGLSSHGYVVVGWRIAPRTTMRAYEHRVVMGNPIGEVHHRNGDKTDNRLENLEVLTPAEHRQRHAELKAVDTARAAVLYHQGWSLRRIAKSFGVSMHVIALRLHKANVAIRNNAGMPPKLTRDQAIAAMARVRQGERQAEIAKTYGVHKSTISNVCRGIGCYGAWTPGREPVA